MLGSAKTLLVSLSVLGLVAAACGSSAKTSAGTTKSTAAAQGPTTTADAAMAPHEMGDKGSFFLKGAEQHSDGKAVVVEDAVLAGTSGWVVIHEQTGGAMGRIIGESTLLPPGPTMAVTVSLMHPLTASATVVAVLHLEDNNNTSFDFPNGDQEAKVGGAVVELPIQVIVP